MDLREEENNKNEFDRSFTNYNKFLEENDIEPLKDNYNIEELEHTIISSIEKNNKEKLKEQWSYEISIKDCNIATLFYHKDNNHIVLLLMPDSKKIEFKNSKWGQAIYIKSMLRKGRTMIPNVEAFGETSQQRASVLMSALKVYNLKKYDIDKYNFAIYEDLSEGELKNKIHSISNESEKWNNIAKILLEPFVDKLLDEFESLEIEHNCSVEDFEIKKEKLEQLLNNDLKEDIQNKKIFQFYGKWNFYDLLIIDGCFFAIIENLVGVDEVKNVIYGVFSDKDTISVRDREQEEKGEIDVSIPYLNTQKASVVGRTIVGQALGGTVGGVIGAYSAIEENNKREMLRKNHEPIIHNYKYNYEEKEIVIYPYYENEEIKGKNSRTLAFKLDKNVFSQQEIENTIIGIKSARSKENLINGEIIKSYFEANNLESFNKEQLENYIKKTRIDNYWKEHQQDKRRLEQKLEELQLYEKNIQIEISNKDNENKPKIDKIKSKYNYNFEEESQIEVLTKEIKELTDKGNQMNFFKFIEKNKIRSSIDERNNKVEQLQLVLREKKDETLKKMQAEIDLIENDINGLKKRLEKNLREQQEVRNELEKDR